MTAQEIRELDTPALLAKVEEYKKELFGLRFQQATGQLENTARIRQVRKTIARIKTVIREIIVKFILVQLYLLKWIKLLQC